MPKLWIKETFCEVEKFTDADGNEDEHSLRYSDSEPYESAYDTLGQLYRSLAREYGRCESRMYRTVKNQDIACGWVFRKRAKYEDKPTETYLQETWVTVMNKTKCECCGQTVYKPVDFAA